MMRAWWQFRVKKIAICPTDKTDDLITDGIYHLTRNPMYLGITMMLFGLGAWVGTAPFFAAATGFFVVMNGVFCPYEEAKLTVAFGHNYEQYAAHVRRWL